MVIARARASVLSSALMTPPNDEPSAEDLDLTPEEEDELERCFNNAMEAERKGELITHEVLFPRPRLTG